MKARQVVFVLVGLVSLTAISPPLAVASDDDSRDVTPEEQAKIGKVLESLGCYSWDDMEFEIDDQLYEVDDVKCKDGQEYDVYLDKNYQVKFKRKD